MSSASRTLNENLAAVRERIGLAAQRAGRRSEDITLVAVSKTHSARKIRELYEAGVRHFGENRVQERETKLSQVASLEAVWHMIGHLQKNKAARAVRLFETIESLDSIALAEKLDRAQDEFNAEIVEQEAANKKTARSSPGKLIRVLVEVKLDPEPAKSGVDAADVPRFVRALTRFSHLDMRGLMCVPPYFDDPEESRSYFRFLREMRDGLREQSGAPEMLPVLSMGMSHDFEIAIEEGSTEVRIGTALFGEREGA